MLQKRLPICRKLGYTLITLKGEAITNQLASIRCIMKKRAKTGINPEATPETTETAPETTEAAPETTTETTTETAPATAPAKDTSAIALGVSLSWQDEAVRNKRLERTSVHVKSGDAGMDFASVGKAFEHFKLPMNKFPSVRAKLKALPAEAEGGVKPAYTFHHDGKDYIFSVSATLSVAERQANVAKEREARQAQINKEREAQKEKAAVDKMVAGAVAQSAHAESNSMSADEEAAAIREAIAAAEAQG